MKLVEDIPANAAGTGGVCYLCGDDDHPGEPALDTEVVIDMEGFLVICARCIADAARLYGFISPEEADHLKSEVHVAQDHAAVVESQLDTLRADVTRVLA